MTSAFCYLQVISNRLSNNCIKLYWYWVSSSWILNGVRGGGWPKREVFVLADIKWKFCNCHLLIDIDLGNFWFIWEIFQMEDKC